MEILAQRIYTLGNPSSEKEQVIAAEALRCAKARLPFDAHDARWIVTMIDVSDDILIIEGVPLR